MKGSSFKNITLEMSLKPFKKKDPGYIRSVCREVFAQWQPLLRHTGQVSVLMWTADGSEILDYTGDPAQRLEWARYIGNPNSGRPVGSEPDAPLSLHKRAFLYMDDPPEYTIGDLRFIVQCIKEEGERITGKPVRVGATFDPGPEFAKSEFKYSRHPEICMADTMGHKSFVCCYAVLHKDDTGCAGFPGGIPEGTPFGTFFGRQAQHFLTDMDYDYIWLSNGFGFGLETWASTGAIFSGTEFNAPKLFETREKILSFWQLFRKECPGFRIETRGTNLSTGIDLAKDGVDLREIYRGGFDILPPPNSPWAAIDGDFGLELTGYLSRMAELPGDEYIFRFYTHDPWWVNSPWIDRYGREPHDIYLPMACARINRNGETVPPSHLSFLTIDDSSGNLPAQVPIEVTPHILQGRRNAPDAPGPFVWVYPFDEYHNLAYAQQHRISEVFAGDWIIRQALNSGFPLNTVVSTAGLLSSLEKKPGLYNETVLVATVPEAGSAMEAELIRFVKEGGKIFVYGSAAHAGSAFLNLLNLSVAEPLEGEFEISYSMTGDKFAQGAGPAKIRHSVLLDGGGVEPVVADRNDPSTRVLAMMKQGNVSRDVLTVRSPLKWNGGKVVYFRGTHSCRYTGGRLLTPDDPGEFFSGPLLMRYALNEFGYTFRQDRLNPGVKSSLTVVARNRNGFVFSGYVPDTTVRQRFRFPQGAPLLLGYETLLEDGGSTYYLPRGWQRECRVFVLQASGKVSCKEQISNEKGIVRRLEIDGLENADVVFYPDPEARPGSLRVYLNTDFPWLGGLISFQKGSAEFGDCRQVTNVTGRLGIAW